MLSVRLLAFVLLFGLSVNEDATVPESVTNNTPQVITESSELVTSIPVTEVTTLAVTDADSDPIIDHTDAENGLEEPRLLPDFVNVSKICTVCNCTKNAVDCKNRDLHSPFYNDDWIGMQKLNFQDITNVDLSGNHFVALPQLPALPIKRLNLSRCEIEMMDDGAFSNLKYLTILDLSRNKMSNSLIIGKRVFMGVLTDGKGPSQFMYLEHLSLAYNELHSLSQGVFTYMIYLTYLDLSGNSLFTINDGITMGSLEDIVRLKELRISECDLESLPTGIFRRLRSLERLDLSGNRFTEVPKVLSEAINLQYLNFNGNPIQGLTERTAISDLRKLKELHLSRLSKLRSINRGALQGLDSLIKLHMSYNPRLTDLDPKFMEWEDDLGVEKWPFLEELYLNNNNISGIDSRFLERWDFLKHADFSANPYACNCNNQWMVKVLVPLIMHIANASTAKMICHRPYDYRGLSFAQLYEFRKTLPCPESEGVTEASSPEIAVLYGVLVGILTAFPLVMVVVLLWKNGFFAKCRKKMTSKHDYDDEEIYAF